VCVCVSVCVLTFRPFLSFPRPLLDIYLTKFSKRSKYNNRSGEKKKTNLKERENKDDTKISAILSQVEPVSTFLRSSFCEEV